MGGPATYIPKLAEHLVSQGHVVSVLTLSDAKQKSLSSELWQTHLISRAIPLPVRILWTATRIAWAARKTDVIFANGLHQEVALSKFLINKPAVAKIVGDPVWERFRNNTNSKMSIEDFNVTSQNIGLQFQRKFLSWGLNRFELVTAPSKGLIDIIGIWGVQTPKLLIENGTMSTTPKKSEEIYDAISVSRLVPWKNLDLLVTVAAEGNFRVAICGEGPEKERLVTIAKSKGARVDFLGELSPNEVREKLQASKCFVNLSSYEGLSFSLIEAMMESKACIVTDIKGNTDVINNDITGLIIPVDSTAELFNAIQNCVTNEEIKIRLGKSAREKALRCYSEEKQLNKMMDSLLKLANHA